MLGSPASASLLHPPPIGSPPRAAPGGPRSAAGAPRSWCWPCTRPALAGGDSNRRRWAEVAREKPHPTKGIRHQQKQGTTAGAGGNRSLLRRAMTSCVFGQSRIGKKTRGIQYCLRPLTSSPVPSWNPKPAQRLTSTPQSCPKAYNKVRHMIVVANDSIHPEIYQSMFNQSVHLCPNYTPTDSHGTKKGIVFRKISCSIWEVTPSTRRTRGTQQPVGWAWLKRTSTSLLCT